MGENAGNNSATSGVLHFTHPFQYLKTQRNRELTSQDNMYTPTICMCVIYLCHKRLLGALNPTGSAQHWPNWECPTLAFWTPEPLPEEASTLRHPQQHTSHLIPVHGELSYKSHITCIRWGWEVILKKEEVHTMLNKALPPKIVARIVFIQLLQGLLQLTFTYKLWEEEKHQGEGPSWSTAKQSILRASLK